MKHQAKRKAAAVTVPGARPLVSSITSPGLSAYERRINLTMSDRERLAYITADTKAVALFQRFQEHIETEPDEDDVFDDQVRYYPTAETETIGRLEANWKTMAWCLARLADAIRAAKPLKNAQMKQLADELDGLLTRMPLHGSEEAAFKVRIDRICGLRK